MEPRVILYCTCGDEWPVSVSIRHFNRYDHLPKYQRDQRLRHEEHQCPACRPEAWQTP